MIKIDESWVEPSIIFAVSVGVPGSMKSPPMGVVNKAANILNRAYAREYREAYEKYGDDYREWEMERKSLAKEGTAPPRPPQEPVMRTCVVKDTTIEAYEEALESNPRGVPAIADELSGWYRRLNMYRQGKGADKTWWLERHNTNEPINTKRKGRKDPLLVQRPHVCLYGTIQPGVLPEINEDDDGLLERFLLAYPDSAVPLYSPEEITAAAQEAWERLYNALRSLHMPVDDYGDPLPQEVVLEERAKKFLVAHVNELAHEARTPGFPIRLGGVWSKMRAYLARLSLILALARCAEGGEAERVELEDVEAAWKLVEYFCSHARRVETALRGEGPPLRTFLFDLATFVRKQGGYWKGRPSDLFGILESKMLPSRPAELTEMLNKLAKEDTGLEIVTGKERFPTTEDHSTPVYTLSLGENVSNAVNAVNEDDPGRSDEEVENAEKSRTSTENEQEGRPSAKNVVEKTLPSTPSTSASEAAPNRSEESPPVDLKRRITEKLREEEQGEPEGTG